MSRRIVYQGRKIQVAVEETTGTAGTIIKRDVVVHPGAVAILPLVDRDHVCLLQTSAPLSAGRSGKSPQAPWNPANLRSRLPRASWPRRRAIRPRAGPRSASSF